MSSDSSEEENLDLLKEAQDAQFINDSMFSDSPAKSTPGPQSKPLPSLRKIRDETGQYDLKVTPEFRKYVAKQLTQILDRQLSKKFADLEAPEVPRKKRKKGGVRLLSECEDFLEVSEQQAPESKEIIAHNVKAKRVKNSKKRNGEVTEDLLTEVAVSAEDILSKKEVKRKKGGVRLLSECEDFLEVSEQQAPESKEIIAHNVKAKRVKNSKKRNGEVTEDLLTEVAVSAEDILSKKEVKNWSKRSKAPVFHYKKTKNGQLKLEEPDFK